MRSDEIVKACILLASYFALAIVLVLKVLREVRGKKRNKKRAKVLTVRDLEAIWQDAKERKHGA